MTAKNISDEKNFTELVESLHSMLKDIRVDVKNKLCKLGKHKFTNIAEDWKSINNKWDEEKLITETLYILVTKLLLAKVISAKNLVEIKSQSVHSIKRIYNRVISEFYPNFENLKLFDWYAPDEKLISRIFEILDHYDFKNTNRDILGKLYERFLDPEERKKLGQFYTPEIVIDYILESVGYREGSDVTDKRLIDIACGSGGFLVRTVEILQKSSKKKGQSAEEILTTVQKNIFGFDINPFACYLAEINLFFVLIDLIAEAKRENKNFKMKKFHIYTTDSINKSVEVDFENRIVHDIKMKQNGFSDGFDFVVGNPPYLEAKIMPNRVKDICKKNFPKIAVGAFDLFVCFIKMALDILKDNGKLGYIIPNKFLTSNYALKLREHVLHNLSIKQLVDVSDQKIFYNTMVYPIIIILQKSLNEENKIKIASNITDLCRLMKEPGYVELAQKVYENLDNKIFFIPPQDSDERNIVMKILENNYEKLGKIANINWTISFHKEGLREKFLSTEKKGKFSKKILGGKSFGGNADVRRYSINWSGWWINYDAEKAKSLNNQFPPKEIFENKKLIICQNSRRLVATYDNQGWYCKDIFFVASLKDKKSDEKFLKYLLALLNSKLLTYYYGVVFRGTHVAGGYLHFLPMYMNNLPIKISSEDIQKTLVNLVNKILDENIENEERKEIDREIDEIIYNIYELSSKEKSIVEKKINYDYL